MASLNWNFQCIIHYPIIMHQNINQLEGKMARAQGAVIIKHETLQFHAVPNNKQVHHTF